MMTMAGSIVSAVLRTLGSRTAVGGKPCCRRHAVRSEADIRAAAAALAPAARMAAPAVQSLLRELVALNTPALYLGIVQRPGPVRVVLHPWGGRTLRFRGPTYLLDAGSEATEGVEAFVAPPFARATSLYATTPDHPVYAVAIEHQGVREVAGSVPAWLTHVTIVVNGRVVTQGERLLHERGPQIWAA